MDEKVGSELEKIADHDGGILYPEHVVEYASNKKTALHPHFEWDDSIGGHQYRLWQARQLISVYVFVEPSTQKDMQVFASISTDRKQTGENGLAGGYRRFVDVMSDDVLRKQFMSDAVSAFNHWRDKYNSLKELTPVFKAGDRVFKKLKT